MIISKDDEYTRYFFTLSLTTDTNVKPRLYIKLDIIAPEKFPRLAKQVVTDSITTDGVLVQANKIFAPYTLKFATLVAVRRLENFQTRRPLILLA